MIAALYVETLVLDCFSGSGTTLRAARSLKRHYIGIEISAAYTALARQLLVQETKSQC
jgi:DNA modification methylase